VILDLRDVRGHPVPGVPGMGRRPIPRPNDLRFATLLAKAGAERARPTAGRVVGAPAAGIGARLRSGPKIPAWSVGLARPTATPRRPPPSAPEKQGLVASIHRAAQSAGLSPALSVAVARAESDLDPRARSADGLSVGTFQVTHETKAEMRHKIATGRVERPAGPDDVALGVGYLRYLHDLFGRRAALGRGLETVPVGAPDERRLFAVAAFNAGEGRVAEAQARAAAAGGDPTRFEDVRPYLPAITRTYVGRVVDYARAESGPRG
jgi:soluble lytic murein transglycosylase-like protein